jgi:hypothetical protein
LTSIIADYILNQKEKDMSQHHVVPGRIAHEARRKTAAERLEKHLGKSFQEHEKNHGFVFDDLDKELQEKSKKHDQIQREELKHIQMLMSDGVIN